MNKRLNIELIKKVMDSLGLNNSQVSERLAVSRTIVGEWLAEKKFPRPDKLVRLGMLLKLPHTDLVVDDAPLAAVVNFRKKSRRALTDTHFADALKKAMLLDLIADYLPEGSLEVPPVLKNPSMEYAYIQKAVALVRGLVGKSLTDVINYSDLVEIIHTYDVVPVPVFWGVTSCRDNDAHGLHIESPRSKKEWIYINLDSYLLDFKFWVAHEIGHIITKCSCDEVFSENFAELFAQSFLFPEEMAAKTYTKLVGLNANQLVVEMIALAETLFISPYTIYKSVNSYAVENGLAQLEKLNSSYVVIKKYVENKSTLIEKLRNDSVHSFARKYDEFLSPEEYVYLAETYFKTPIFDSLKKFLGETSKGDGFLQSLFDIQAVEAKELHYYLTH
ncbi:hypothetical protein H4684_003420 [Desulfomicrobium macestii]|uniref:HTH cro/C1-type domain-containing protein n=1 Tax=Desulfomicrobium macestii TaxID=90731 RepID=A0ABR9H7Q3_9BACT|nr:helix-turn-helix transcriptional regulator [Desulfomicrobium macestii]MBE1426746.1 hypothetical protein [Desulfomicrobium macestii]